ncbi:MAG: DALR domain-containing protein, partial [Ilumatobacteraceae bacterium]
SKHALFKLKRFILEECKNKEGVVNPAYQKRFHEAMNDDLDTPRATALLFDTVRRANTAIDAGETTLAASLAAAVNEICAAVGLRLEGPAEVPAEVAARAVELDEARAAKDFVTADAIRAELQAAGWTVETTRDGTTVRR